MTEDATDNEPADSTIDPDGEPEVLLDAYDLDGDGKISSIEDARATLGVVDARLEEIIDEGGLTGKIADAAHHIVDKLDND